MFKKTKTSIAQKYPIKKYNIKGFQQKKYHQKSNEKLNVRQAEELAKKLKNPKQAAVPKELPHNLRKVEKSLADALAVKVEIKSSAKGNKGKIVLNFSNESELEKILSHFS